MRSVLVAFQVNFTWTTILSELYVMFSLVFVRLVDVICCEFSMIMWCKEGYLKVFAVSFDKKNGRNIQALYADKKHAVKNMPWALLGGMFWEFDRATSMYLAKERGKKHEIFRLTLELLLLILCTVTDQCTKCKAFFKSFRILLPLLPV